MVVSPSSLPPSPINWSNFSRSHDIVCFYSQFRTAVLALAALGGASAKVVDLTNGYTFEQFLVDFGKTYDAKEVKLY